MRPSTCVSNTYGAPKIPIGETVFTPCVAARSARIGSVVETGLMEVSNSLPGIVSVSQLAPILRTSSAAVPRATTIATPTTRAPAVRAVRLRSRDSELRASRSSLRKMRSGKPATRPSGPISRGTRSTDRSSRPYTTSGPQPPGPLPVTREPAPESPLTPLGQTARAATANTPKTTTNQRKRAEPAAIPAGPRRNASTGGIRPARQAGSSDAASVSTVPISSAITIDPAESDGPASETGPDEPTQVSVATARPIPARTPTSEPAAPRTRACTSISPIT